MLDPNAAYCLWCGAPLEVRALHGAPRHACPRCPFVHYRSPAAAVCAVVVRGREVLLIERRVPPGVGKWALPGGFQDYGEDAAATAVREVLEETGLRVALLRLLDVCYSQDDPRKRVNVIAYLAKVVDGELRAADDAAQARFFALDALPSDLAFANNRALLARLAAEHPTGDLT